MEHTLTDDTRDLFSGPLNKENNIRNPCRISRPEEELQGLVEEIFQENLWENEVLYKSQASITHQEVPPLFIQEFNQNWNINPQVPHFQVKAGEPSNSKVTFSKEMDKKSFEGILKKEADENKPSAYPEQACQDQLTSEEKGILELYDALFNMGSQQIETTNLAQRLELTNSQITQEITILSGQIPAILHQNPSN
ncbi:hypothetical protein O181_028392 [Austropuccinia psidii MF-1]|uniref:Uncharacterized protein n=1 Tax=Austropuccinia psidii MF-1 TaxID=1389203 RepID=A0A9Q3CRT5_9BASI|nr:hypothetical protein [Austropuccinia psidii MF-1]